MNKKNPNAKNIKQDTKKNPSVSIIRSVIAVAAAVVFAVYVIKNEAAYDWYEFLLPFTALLGITILALIAAPRAVKVLSGGDDFCFDHFDKPKNKRKTFWLICLFALLLHALTYVIGVLVYSKTTMSDSSWYASFWEKAWMKSNTDAGHYLNIAENWYVAEGDDKLLLVFFPMLPVLIRGLNLIVGNSFVSAMIINSAATALTSGFTYLTLLPILGSRRSKHAAFLALLLPGAIFLNSPMTEPLFMLFSVLGFMFLQKRDYVLAGLFTALAGFTRSLGVLLAVPIAFIGIGHIVSLIKGKKPFGRTAASLVVGLVISTFGTLGYLWINYSLHGDPLKFFEFQWGNWHQKACPFFDTPRYMLDQLILSLDSKMSNVYSLWGPGFAAIYGSLTLMCARAKKLPASYVLYFIAYFAVSVGCTWLLSPVRYLCAAFPIIAACGSLTQKRFSTILVYVIMIAMYFIYLAMYMMRLGIY